MVYGLGDDIGCCLVIGQQGYCFYRSTDVHGYAYNIAKVVGNLEIVFLFYIRVAARLQVCNTIERQRQHGVLFSS